MHQRFQGNCSIALPTTQGLFDGSWTRGFHNKNSCRKSYWDAGHQKHSVHASFAKDGHSLICIIDGFALSLWGIGTLTFWYLIPLIKGSSNKPYLNLRWHCFLDSELDVKRGKLEKLFRHKIHACHPVLSNGINQHLKKFKTSFAKTETRVSSFSDCIMLNHFIRRTNCLSLVVGNLCWVNDLTSLYSWITQIFQWRFTQTMYLLKTLTKYSSDC